MSTAPSSSLYGAETPWLHDDFSPTTDMYTNTKSTYNPLVDSPLATTSIDSPIHSSTATTTASDGNSSENNNNNSAKALELRRQRNRESMRRTRQKTKETVSHLQSTLTKLETQYARLMAPCTTNGPFDGSQEAARKRAAHASLQAKLQQLVALRRSLETENVAISQVITQKQALEKQLQQLLDENALDEMVNEKLALLEASSSSGNKEAFTALTASQVDQLISSFCGELQRIKSAAAAVAIPAWSSPSSATSSAPPLQVFGWLTKRHVDAASNEMHFEFTKTFDHLHAHEMTHRAWQNGMDVHKFRATERQLNIRRLDFLQHVSPNIKVMVREIVHPVDHTVFRTNYLTFKQAVHNGFLVGMVSVNPPLDEQKRHELLTGEKVIWIDVSVSIELLDCSNTSPQAASVCWRGSTNYKSPQYAAESAVKFLMGVLRWEFQMIGPQLQFVF